METLLRFFLGALAQYVMAFIKNLRAARADNPRLIEIAAMIVDQIGDAHPEWSGEEKRKYAFSAIQEAWKELLKDLLSSAGKSMEGEITVALPSNADSLTNTLLELVYQKRRATPQSGEGT